MKITSCTNRVAFLILTFCSIANIYPDTNVQTLEKPQEAVLQQEQIQDLYQSLLSQQLSQFKAIDFAIEDLMLAIGNDAIPVKNKRAFRESAKDLRGSIQAISKEAFVQINGAQLHMLNFICEQFINHLITAIDNGCTELPFCTIDITRHKPIDPTLEELQERLAITAARLQRLNAKAETAGLRWYNKGYRTFDSWVIQPTEKYKLAHWAAGITAATLVVGLCIHKHIDNDNTGWWRTFFGKRHVPAIKLGEGQAVESNDNKNLGTLGKIEKAVHDIYNPSSLETLIRGSIAIPIIYPVAKSVYQALTTKLRYCHNQLKGGTFAKMPEEKHIINPRVKFDDLVGLDDAKETLSTVVKYLENPERFTRNNLVPHKGYLLTGASRTGKSFMAEALAGEIQAMFKRTGRSAQDLNFYPLTAAEIEQNGIKTLISAAKNLAPCILFIDEIHLLNLQQVTNSKTLSEFLSAMSGCLEEDPDKVVIIVAATNRPETLDKALRQQGRFGKEIHFTYPSYTDRKTFLERKINSITDASAFDLEKLARESEGKSYEGLGAMITSACQKALIRGCAITQELLEASFDSEVRNLIIENNMQLDKDEQRLLAINQAGHALAMTLLPECKEQLAKVTISPYMTDPHEEYAYMFNQPKEVKQAKVQYGKLFSYHTKDTRNIKGYQDYLLECKLLLAGHAAEQIILGASSYSYRKEAAQQAFDIMLALVSKGLAVDKFPDTLKAQYLEKALALRDVCEKEVTALLEANKETLLAITQALLAKESLTGAEVALLAGITPLTTPVDAGIVARDLGIQEIPA